MFFKNIPKRRCPECDELVDFEGAPVLSTFECPFCGNKMIVPGKVDNFILHSHLGEGEMGTIYTATDESLGREVAVKVVRGCHADDPAQRERLRREACAAGRLNHPKVAQVYALNFSNGNPYLVMELVAGLDFAEKLAKEGPIEEKDVLRMALDVAEGLSALHREGLVHGDIKPANIVLDLDGNAKLVDFGLSGMMRHDGHGNLVGTPHYLAPEILRGEPDSHRTDLYSLGGTMYYLLCGRLPFEGETPEEILKARLKDDPLPLDDVAPAVSRKTCSMIMRLLHPYPEKRHKNSDALSEEIKAVLKSFETPKPKKLIDKPSVKRRPATVLPPRASANLSKARMRVILVLLFIAVVGLGVVFKQRLFPATWRWLRDDVREFVRNTAARVRGKKSRKRFAPGYVWKSRTVGDYSKRGSTMQFGEILLMQSSGKDMWLGEENYRFFSVDCSDNYSFIAKVIEFPHNNDYDIGGLLIKNQDVNNPAGLLFGFLGSGHLFLQVRGKGQTAEVLKCQKNIVELPVYLKIKRVSRVYAAYTSSNGEEWTPFASSEMDLQKVNAVGLTVSSQNPDTVASAKFSSVNLKMATSVIAAPTNTVTDSSVESKTSLNRTD